MLPMALAAGVVQVNVYLDHLIAMGAGSWGPAVLGYADRLVYLPLALFGTSFAMALLPSLSGSAAEGDYRAFAADFQRSLAAICGILLPASLGLLALSHPIIRAVYERGNFDGASTVRTAHALSAYSIGLVAAGVAKVAPQPFYALQDSKTPVNVGLACVGANLCMNLLFVWLLPPEWKPIGIAFATSLSSTLQCLVLLAFLARRERNGTPLFRWRPLFRPLGASAVAAAAMGLAAWRGFGWAHSAMRRIFGTLPFAGETCALVSALLLDIALSMALYAALLRLLCPGLLRDATAIVRRRRKAPPAPPKPG